MADPMDKPSVFGKPSAERTPDTYMDGTASSLKHGKPSEGVVSPVSQGAHGFTGSVLFPAAAQVPRGQGGQPALPPWPGAHILTASHRH